MRIQCTTKHVEVHGLLWTRRIDLADVDEVDHVGPLPAMRWTDRHRRKRWTPLSALMSGPLNVTGLQERNVRELAKLADWVRRHRTAG